MKIMGCRTAIQDALAYAYTGSNQLAEFLTYLCKIDKSTSTGTAQFALTLQYARIRAGISDQRYPIPEWIMYAYGPDLADSQKDHQKRRIALTIAESLTPSVCSLKRKTRLVELCALAVEDYRLGMFLGKTLPNRVYSDALEVREDNFPRDWGKSRDQALEQIKRLDNEGIANISIIVREIREAG